MNLKDLKRVNDLWIKIYPYLALQVREHFGRSSGNVLELGPFSGGISMEMARLCSGLTITVAAEEDGVLDLLRKGMEGSELRGTVKFRRSELDRLEFSDAFFDLVVFRGAYFFLDEEGKILREIYRVLREEGLGFVGGGYGKNTPQPLIDEIADESRVLNDRLGRKRVTEEAVRAMVTAAGLTGSTSLEKSGGLWLVIRK